MALGFGLSPRLPRRGGEIMSDFETISIVIMILTLLFVAMSYSKRDK